MPAELVCTTCQHVAPPDTLRWRCPCGGMYDVRAPASFPRDAMRARPQTLWRYREALPLSPTGR